MANSPAMEARRNARTARENDLSRKGATRTQAYAMALEEAWKVEAEENERLRSVVGRLHSVIEDAAHFSEMGRDVSRYLRETGLGQEHTEAIAG